MLNLDIGSPVVPEHCGTHMSWLPALTTASRYVFYALLIGCMAYPHELESVYISLGFMKLYVYDVAFLILILTVAAVTVYGKTAWRRLPFNSLVFVFLLLGVMASIVGYFITGNPYYSVLGDFRRTYFYFSAYGIALVLTQSTRHLKSLYLVLLAGSMGAIAKGIVQLCLGYFDIRRVGDAAHILNHIEATFCMFAIFWALTRIGSRLRTTFPYIFIAGAGIAVVAVANFRTCWISLLLGVTAFLILSVKRWRYVVMGAVSALVMAVALIAGLWLIPVSQNGSSLGSNLTAKANISNFTSDQNVQWRINSYRNALNLWRINPILGRGLGEVLTFRTSTSTGDSMVVTGHRVHNSYLWILMSTGVIGLTFFAYFHFQYLRIVLSAISSATEVVQTALISSISFYFAMMTTACFDVFLESASPTIILSAVMAMTLILAQDYAIQKIPYRAIPA